VKNIKLQVVGYGLALLGFFIGFVVVGQFEQTFGIDTTAREKTNQEFQVAISQLEQNCSSKKYATTDEEFIFGRVCRNSQSLRIELDHLRKKNEEAENEVEAQFWLSVMIMGSVFAFMLLSLFKLIEWFIQSRSYKPVVIKVPRVITQFA